MWSGPGTTETRERPNRGRRAVASALFAVVAVVLVWVGVDARPAAAQAPVGLFGLWTQDRADPIPDGAKVVAVYPAEGGTAETVRVALRFVAPFTPAANGYRASVVIGDPAVGPSQLRVSYRTVDGGAVGTMERKVGDDWTDLGLIEVEGTPADRVIVFDVPTRELRTPSSLWVDIGVPSASEATAPFVSGYFPFAAFVSEEASAATAGDGTAGAGAAGVRSRASITSAWGQADTAGTTTPFPLQPALKPPLLSVADRGLLVSTELPAPTGIDGRHVAGIVDRVHLVGSDLHAPSPGYLQIDRVSGSVDLYAVSSGSPVLVTGADPWLGTAPDPDAPGAPVTVTADLPTVARLLGLPDDVAQLAVSADRTIELDDARTIVAVGMGATVDTLSEAAAAADRGETPDGAAVAATSDEGVQVGIVLIAAGIAVLVVLGVAWFLFGSGRRPGPVSRAAVGGAGRRPTPDAVLAALELQFSELGIELPGSAPTRSDEPTMRADR